MTTREELEELLTGVKAPLNPKDGDCLRWAPDVTNELQRQGLPANLATVIGWADFEAQVIAFAHQATECDGWIIDFTARQFNVQLPARWICVPANYSVELANMARVQKVTVRK